MRTNREYHQEYEESTSDPNMLRQYRVNISPTLLKVCPGREEETNRVIRRFQHSLQSFVRMNFVTETDGKGFYFGEGSGFLLGYIHKTMHCGFYLGNRLFRFLQYSNSQLKNHACWFLCSNDEESKVSEQAIEATMGEFDQEKNILKRFARRGQCFSTTKFVCELNPDEVVLGVEDIVRRSRNNYCFTDGVGYISPQLALETAKKFRFS